MNNYLTTLIDNHLDKNPERVAFKYKKFPGGTTWEPTLWSDFSKQVNSLTARLLDSNIGVQDTIAIFSANRPEILISDFAAYAVRAIPVSIYSTSSAEQVKYIVNDSKASILFVGDEKQSEDMVNYLLQQFEGDTNKLWQTNIFGRSFNEIVGDDLQSKLKRMPEPAQKKMREALERIINEGGGGLICIIL